MKNIYYKTLIIFIALSLFYGSVNIGSAQSILNTGKWYKIQIEQNGVYRLNHQDFVDMGFDIDNIDPAKIHIYGNIEGVLPEHNYIDVPEELIENPIHIEGMEDGTFDTEDYVLFYAQGPDTWTFDRVSQAFRFYSHPYDDYNYYYVGVNEENGKRIIPQESSSSPPIYTITKFIDYQVHEIDLLNFIKSGRRWFGESFDEIDNSLELSFNFPNIDTTEKVSYGIYVAGKSRSASSININLNNENSNQLNIPKITGSGEYTYAKEALDRDYFYTNTNAANFHLTYNQPDATSNAWLDYFEVSAHRKLKMEGHQMFFNSDAKEGLNQVLEFQLENINNSIKVWNISNPYEVTNITGGTISNNTLNYTVTANEHQYFITFDSEEFLSPTFIKEVENQNLKELNGFDMSIITVDEFLEEAQRLADFHALNDQLHVNIVTVDQVYNEFSSGKQDPTAIRNYLRYHYRNAENDSARPEYLLLFGDASYDYKDILPQNNNLVPVYQSKGSLSTTQTYDTDDYYGIMNNADGDSSLGTIQISVGRFPVHTIELAKTMVDKTIHYASNSEKQMRNWRNNVCFIADDADGNLHLNNSDKLADTFLIEHPEFNVDKIYLDAYVRKSTSNGYRYPDVQDAINRGIEEGILFMNYTGHGGHLALTDERVMQIPDIQSWRNIDKLSIFIVASCEFGPFDDPHHVSAGEHVVHNPLGGGVALFTTTRLAYASYNFKLNKKFHEIAFSRKENGAHYRLGEIIKYAKNESGNQEKNLNFCLLGDPALKMAYPEYHVETTHINNKDITKDILDTIKARQTVTIKAQITDIDHDIMSDFDGMVQVCVYGQPSVYTTLANNDNSHKADFKVIDEIIYKGVFKANKGEIEFSFVVPSGINPQYGTGKISYYATNNTKESINFDANGGYLDFIIGGVDETIEEDLIGPNIDVFLENRYFIDGGTTSTDPIMIIDLFDESGINNVQLGFGRDITAQIDNNPNFVLNDYYVNDIENFKKGNIEYPINELDFGLHELKIKAWDMFDNPSTKSVSFIVMSPETIQVYDVLNRPNPFKELTEVVFNHNQLDEDLLFVNISIYNIKGQRIYQINEEATVLGNTINPIQLSIDDMNIQSAGFYSYIIEVKNIRGQTIQQKQKFIVVK